MATGLQETAEQRVWGALGALPAGAQLRLADGDVWRQVVRGGLDALDNAAPAVPDEVLLAHLTALALGEVTAE